MADQTVVEDLFDRLRSDEDVEIEFKLGSGGLPLSMWETVSAFANTSGGWIILGVDKNSQAVGVPNARARVKEIFDNSNNPEKLSAPILDSSSVAVRRADSVDLVVVRVPAVPLRQRPIFINGNPFTGTFVRRHEGDYRCRPDDVRRMIRESQADIGDESFLLGWGVDHLDPDSVRSFRQRFAALSPGNPWNAYDDARFLAAASVLDDSSGALTVAGLLLLGRPESIVRWRGRHLIDYRHFKGDSEDRIDWDDRVAWEGNLLGAFDAIYSRLVADQPKPFRVDKTGIRQEESQVHVALREALVNLLVHADYAEQSASLIIRTTQEFRFRNPGSSRVPERDLFDADRSDPRNPLLVRLFRLIGLAEEAGTGIPRILRAWRDLGLKLPRIDVGTERYEFTLQLSYAHLLSDQDLQWLDGLGEGFSPSEQLALCYARHEGRVDNISLRRLTGQHPADTTKLLVRLRDAGYLAARGSGRGAYYELNQELVGTTQEELPLEVKANLEGSQKAVESLEDKASDLDDKRLLEIAEPVRVRGRVGPGEVENAIVNLCSVRPLTIRELTQLLNRSENYLRLLVRRLQNEHALTYLYPDSPSHPRQAYVAYPP